MNCFDTTSFSIIVVGYLLRSWSSNGARYGIYHVEWALNLVYFSLCFKAYSYYSMDQHFLFTVDYINSSHYGYLIFSFGW